MMTLGVLARFEVKPGTEADVEQFFKEGLAIVQQQKASTVWFAFRLGPTTFGAFAGFASEEERFALLSVGGPVSAQRNSELFAQAPIFEKVDVIAAKLPKKESRMTVGSLVRFETKPGKAADFEQFFERSLLEIQEAPGTTAWFAIRQGPSTFGVFDTFLDEEGRQAHFLSGTARAERASNLLEIFPVVEKVEVIAARLPA